MPVAGQGEMEARPRSEKPILVIGTSHTTAIAGALTPEQSAAIDVMNIASFFDPVGRRNKILHPEVAGMFAPRHIFCCFGGSEHNVLGLMEAPTRFDFHSPTIPDIDASRWIIPRAVVRATLAWRMEKWLQLATTLTGMFAVPVAHLCSPPPFRDVDEKAQLPSAFQDQLQFGIAPRPLRRKLHELHSEIAREHMASIGVRFIAPPAEAMDADGYLLRPFWSRDPTHGNQHYGQLVLRQITEATV